MTQEWTQREDAWAPGWVAARLSEVEQVESCKPVGGPNVRVERTGTLPTVHIACIAVDDVGRDVTQAVIEAAEEVCFIVNVTSGARITGEAIETARREGIAIGGMADVMRALRQNDPSMHEDRSWDFVENGLAQHDAVSHFEILSRGCYRIHRYRHETVDVAVIDDYEVTAESVRNAIGKFGDIDAVVSSNPSAQPIADTAKRAASSAGTRVYLWREFYGLLNRSWN